MEAYKEETDKCMSAALLMSCGVSDRLCYYFSLNDQLVFVILVVLVVVIIIQLGQEREHILVVEGGRVTPSPLMLAIGFRLVVA